RERFRELALEGLAKLLVFQRSTGSLEGAIRTALRIAALDPFQESVHRTLMRLYVRVGRRGAALRQYQQCVSTLHRELGAEPESETKALYGEILRARTARALRDGIAVEDRVDRQFSSGLRQGIEVSRISGPDVWVGAGPRLVGRDPEVAELERAFDDT